MAVHSTLPLLPGEERRGEEGVCFLSLNRRALDSFISLRRRALAPLAWLRAFGARRSRAVRAAARPGPGRDRPLVIVAGCPHPDHGAGQGVRGTGQNSGVKDEKQWRVERRAWGRSALAVPCAARETLRACRTRARETSRLSHSIPPNPAYPGESHLSHRIPLIPANPTYPTESRLSHLIPLIPPNPTYPTESRLSRRIPLNPG